jgi:SAM-dependent methyltransferase
MNYGYVGDIDWEKMWELQASHSLATGKEAAAFWDKRSESYEKNMNKSSYTDELLKRMTLQPEYSVLDVGGGTGLLAIPMAKKVCKVTVLDISNGMLNILKDKAGSSGINNISIVNKNWYEIDVKSEIEPHDVVLASRFLPMGKKLHDALYNMNKAAKRSCYVTWRAQSFDSIEAESCRILNKDYTPYPEYPVICNCLYTMGIKANVDIFESTNEQCFANMEDAIQHFSKGDRPKSKEIENKFSSFVRSLLTEQNGTFYRETTIQWVLIYWQINK